jgi:hypothetical protein
VLEKADNRPTPAAAELDPAAALFDAIDNPIASPGATGALLVGEFGLY